MPNSIDFSTLQQLQWLTLRFHLQLQAPLELPRVPGLLVHSVIGMALQQTAPDVFQQLFAGSDELGRQYALYVPLQESGRIKAGEVWSFEMSLFNHQLAHAGALIEALLHIQQAGLGKQRAPFRLTGFAALDSVGNEQSELTLARALTFADMGGAVGEGNLGVQLLTPLRLKQRGDILRQPPEMAQLLQRLIGRVSGLLGQPAELLLPEYYQQLQHAARECRLLQADIRWLDAERYSARQQRAMVLGGLYGRLDYSQPDSLLWPWLRLMQHLQLGNKTTFGFGKIGIVDKT